MTFDKLFKLIRDLGYTSGTHTEVIARAVMAAYPTAPTEAAAMAATVPAGRQPIATAPRDGTEILLMSPKGRIANGLWSGVNGQTGFWAWPYVNVEPAYWWPMSILQAPVAGQPAEPSPTVVQLLDSLCQIEAKAQLAMDVCESPAIQRGFQVIRDYAAASAALVAPKGDSNG